jgi:hypothetical protein
MVYNYILKNDQRMGHLLYLAYAFYALISEAILTIHCASFHITQNEYTMGPLHRRIFFIVRYLLIKCN